jgi:cysteine desulfurase
MGVLSEGNVRVSLPRGAREEDVERFLAVLPGVVAEVRARLGAEAAPGGAGAAREVHPDGGAGEGDAGGTVVTDEDGPVLDTLGRRCPIPVIELAKAIGGVTPGGTITVLSDDAAARLDIPAWCAMRGHRYEGEAEVAGVPGGVAYRVRRGA